MQLAARLNEREKAPTFQQNPTIRPSRVGSPIKLLTKMSQILAIGSSSGLTVSPATRLHSDVVTHS
jgi:hypothetical protein